MIKTQSHLDIRVSKKKPAVDFVKEQLDYNRIRYGPDLPLACEYERPQIRVVNPKILRMNHNVLSQESVGKVKDTDDPNDFEVLNKLKIIHTDMTIYLWIPRFMFKERVSELVNRANVYENMDMEDNNEI